MKHLRTRLTSALILTVAANTSFAGFPRLTSVLARDGYLPRQFASLGVVGLAREPLVIAPGLDPAVEDEGPRVGKTGHRLQRRPVEEVVPKKWIRVLQTVRKVKSGTPWTVGQFYRELAKLGGFLGRKRDGEPGWITLWRGFQKLTLMVRGAEALRRKCG